MLLYQLNQNTLGYSSKCIFLRVRSEKYSWTLEAIGAEMLLTWQSLSDQRHNKSWIKLCWMILCCSSCKWIYHLWSCQLCYWVSWFYSLISVHWLKGLFLRKLWRQYFTNVHSARKSLKILPQEKSQCHGLLHSHWLLHSQEKDKEERKIKFSFNLLSMSLTKIFLWFWFRSQI